MASVRKFRDSSGAGGRLDGRRGRRGVLAVLALALALLGGPRAALAMSDMTIGVLAFRGETDAAERWTPTARYLSERIDGYRFRILPLTLDGMARETAAGRLDFILTNTGNYVVLEHAHGISRLATLKARHLGADFTQFGAVLFTRSDHPRLFGLADVEGHAMAAVSRDAFGGFQMAWRELLDAGIDPFADLERIEFRGFPQDGIVQAVVSGEVDFGTVRSGTLERMAAAGLVDLDRIRILGARSSDGFPFLHSTRLYPEWPFAKARATPERLAQRVAIALLELEPDSEAARSAYAAGWTIPLDYGPVHELFRELQIGPYAHLGKPSLASVWREYKPWILFSLAMVLVLLGLLIAIARANRRISQSEALLAKHKETLEARVAERTAELAEVNDSLRRSEAALRAIHDITTDADAGFGRKIDELLQEGCRFFDMEYAALGEIRGDEVAISHQTRRNDAVVGRELDAAFARLTRVFARKPELLQPANPGRSEDGAAGEPEGCALGTAFRRGDGDAGFLLFYDRGPRSREFSDVDIDILQLMAQWVGGESERHAINRRAQEHENQLAHVSRVNTMGEVAAGIAHELNQPLTAILNYSNGCLRLLRREGQDQGELHDAITRLGTDARRAAEIIRRLREFIRRENLKHERFVLRDCIDSAVELLRPRLDQYAIDVDVNYAAEVDRIDADRIQIEQVVVNLLLNAIEALRDSDGSRRRIEIDVREQGAGALCVAISDTGDALAGDVVAHLFDPFFTTKPEGMGMGLSISRSIVESHGGTIEYLLNDKRLPTFRFNLPLT